MTGPTGGSRHVALLRGINVGGRHKLPMQQLVRMFEAAGGSSVRSYIASGNVLFDAREPAAARIARAVAAAIAERFGFEAPVVLRSAGELQAVVRANPFVAAGDEPGALHVLFLVDRPAAAQAAALDPARSPPDRFELHGRELFLHCPNGVARTKLTNDYFDRQLGTIGTMRNWRTVAKLAELCRHR
jgi:uncharacterized protein (DUF1697 family)